MPGVHAVADGFGIDPVALRGLIAMCLSIQGLGLFAICYRPVEGVFNLIAFSCVRNGAYFADHEGYEA